MTLPAAHKDHTLPPLLLLLLRRGVVPGEGSWSVFARNSNQGHREVRLLTATLGFDFHVRLRAGE